MSRAGGCTRKPWCELVDEHEGPCDPRPEADRWRALYAALDAGMTDEQVCAELEAGAFRAGVEADRRAARAS